VTLKNATSQTAAGLLDDDEERMIALATYILSSRKALEYGNN